MKVFRVPILVFGLIALLIGLAIAARLTGIWKFEPGHARPQQSVP